MREHRARQQVGNWVYSIVPGNLTGRTDWARSLNGPELGASLNGRREAAGENQGILVAMQLNYEEQVELDEHGEPNRECTGEPVFALG
jgi:hypothetical protein